MVDATRLASHEAPVEIAQLAEHVITPQFAGHTLVVTKSHFENLFEASGEELAGVIATSRRVADAIRATIAPDGLGVFQLNGAAAGQTVFHIHLHLIGGRGLAWPPG